MAGTNIGAILKERMDLLCVSKAQLLADTVSLDARELDAVLADEKPLDEIDPFDLGIICSILHCGPEYFLDKGIRDKDFLNNSICW